MSAPDELWAWVDHNGYLETWVGDQPNERAVRYVRAPTAPHARRRESGDTMTTDRVAVEAALHDLDAAHRCVGSHTLAPDTMRTLEAAARAYLRAPTAPQGAEIAREALRELIAWLRERQMEVPTPILLRVRAAL